MFKRVTDDGAVSSVVGVILMVALTVVLAAVLGQFVFDMASMLSKPPQAGVTFRQNVDPSNPGQYDITVILSTMPNADRVEVRPTPPPGYTGGALAGVSLTEVGQSQMQTYPEGTMLTVVAHNEGEAAVVQTFVVGNG